MEIIKDKLGSLVLHLILIALCLSCLLPLIMVFSISLSSETALTQYGYTLFPKVIDLSAYNQIFKNPHQLIQGYKITIIYSITATILAVFVQSLMAYSLSRNNYKYRKFFTFYLLFTMLFNGGLVPTYILNSQYLHLNNTIWIYIFTGMVSAWNVIVIRTFIKSLPDSLIEAAKIDGASEIKVFFSIVFPLLKPALATIGFLTLLGKWNDWYTSLIYIRDPELYSLQYLLQKILREIEFINKMMQESSSQIKNFTVPTESVRFAMAVLAAGPMIFIFPFFQKYFTKGLTVGSVKG